MGRCMRFTEGTRQYHSTTPPLAELAQRAKPRILILYHWVALSREEFFDDMRSRYTDMFVVGRNLDIY